MIDSTANISAITPTVSVAYGRGWSVSAIVSAEGQSTTHSSTSVPSTAAAAASGGQDTAASLAVSASTPSAKSATAISPTLEQAIETFRQHFGSQQPALVFRIDASDGDVFVSVVDAKDDKVIQQIPDADARRMARALQSSQTGLLKERA